ncbi:MAG TPA: nucleotidyl transferase AbiEii/AbiGii toxin family protein [Solirubrobacterales bacterium]|jgi:predicted nucleotidyltransferase component of viral defense system
MIAQAFVRQFAAGQKIDLDVADQEVVLHYALARLNEIGLVGYPPGEQAPGPLLFKGGTALRKCIFGSTGRFSQDIDLDATHKNGFEEAVEAAFRPAQPYHGIEFSLPRFRYSSDDNFSGTVEYRHSGGKGAFELQISYRQDPILEPVELTLQEQSYFTKAGKECGVPRLFGLDPYEMIGEKIMACNRRQGGSSKDVYDLDLWARRPFDERLVRRLAVLKAWTDRRGQPSYEPAALLGAIEPQNFRWSDISGLVPRDLATDPKQICERVRIRFAFLTELDQAEEQLLNDQVAHRNHRLFAQLRDHARELAGETRA